MKVALASARTVNSDVRHNLSQMERYMAEAARGGAVLVCFGETFLQGFDALSWRFDTDREIGVSVDSALFGDICALSVRYGIDVLFGYIERDGDALYSSCALIANGKLHCNYRRISRGWKEFSKTDGHYREGDSVTAFSYRGRKCLIGLCGDLWELPDRFALGEELLFWPVYVCWTADEWENGGKDDYAKQASLCCRNTLYVNSVCDGDAFGGAMLFTDGRTVKELPINCEGILFADV